MPHKLKIEFVKESRNGYSSYSTTQMIYLLNHGCYIPYTDLKPGDVIFSGYEDAIDDWDSNDDNVHIACRSDAHPQWILKSDANAPSSSEAGYVEFRTTHVRMVYSSTSAIESLGNAIYSTLSDVGVPTGGSIDVREIPQNPVQYNPYINNTPYGDTYDTNSKLYQRLFMCCRPSLLREDNE